MNPEKPGESEAFRMWGNQGVHLFLLPVFVVDTVKISHRFAGPIFSLRRAIREITQGKPARTFERIAAGADCDVLVFGHTHQPWIREYGDVLFVNCGSVGKPKDGDPRASFALLQLDDGEVRATIDRAEYDAEAVAREVTAAGLPSEYAEKLVLAA